MKLFETSSGFIFSFGWDMVTKKRDTSIICWCDPKTKEWEPSPDNKAGNYKLYGTIVCPNVVLEQNGCVIAWQQGRCFELIHFGHRIVWVLRVMKMDKTDQMMLKHSNELSSAEKNELDSFSPSYSYIIPGY